MSGVLSPVVCHVTYREETIALAKSCLNRDFSVGRLYFSLVVKRFNRFFFNWPFVPLH